MKKIIGVVCAMILTVSLFAGCGTLPQETQESISQKAVQSDKFGNEYFTTIAKWNDDENVCRIVYAKDTKVKYFVVSSYRKFGISPLYNADGTLQIYSEE